MRKPRKRKWSLMDRNAVQEILKERERKTLEKGTKKFFFASPRCSCFHTSAKKWKQGGLETRRESKLVEARVS